MPIVVCFLIIGAAAVIVYFLNKLHNSLYVATYDNGAANKVNSITTEILTVIHGEVGIKKPYDECAVWKEPTQEEGGGWLHHAKATQSKDAPLDDDSLEEYRAIFNGRAADLGAPIQVTAIHPRGRLFVYDIVTTGAVNNYQSPNATAPVQDRDF
jgi:hypothetical protein